MTLVVAYWTDDGLGVIADTRIWNEISTLLDSGQKIFEIPIIITPFGTVTEPIRKPSVGFAFAGNTLLAQAINGIASVYLQSLGCISVESGPSLIDIASFFARCSEYVLKQRRFNQPTLDWKFQGMVFGYCPIEREFQFFGLDVDTDERGVPLVQAKRTKVKRGGLIHFGSGSQALEELLDQLANSDDPLTVTPAELMHAIINSSNEPSVGGSIQFATATKDGVQLRPMATVEQQRMSVSVLGCDAYQLGSVGDYVIGAGAIVVLSEAS